MSSAIFVDMFSSLEIYGHTCNKQDRGWLTGTHALALTCVHRQASSKLAQGAGTRGGEHWWTWQPRSNTLSCFTTLPSFEAHLKGNRLAPLQATSTGVRLNVGRLQCSDSRTKAPCPGWTERHRASSMLVSVLERRASAGLSSFTAGSPFPSV